MKLYLASPLFTEYERQKIQRIAKNMRAVGFEVYVPMEHQIENAWDLPNDEWAAEVFAADIKAINECDKVICLYYGLYSDSGTGWECGYAYGIGKPVEVILVGDPKEISLMVAQSAKNHDLLVCANQT